MNAQRSILLTALVALVAAGCHRDMYDQGPHRPLRASAAFDDGQSARPLVAGTIARGQLQLDQAYFVGVVGGKEVDKFPRPLTVAMLQRGQQRYDIYCSVCHSRQGDGLGMIVRRGFRQPPTFHQDRLRGAPVGHLFDVITRGFGAMPAYAKQVPTDDRWAIVAYIRALQLSQNTPLDSLDPSERARLPAVKP
jgi:mono/diheme cytochrome c family protein